MTGSDTQTAFAALRAEAQTALFRELPDHVARLGWDAERIAAHQRDGLRRLLRSAIGGSPFHARRLAGVDPQRFELADLSSLPVLTKADLMTNFDDALTDRRLTRGMVEQALAETGVEPVPILGRYVAGATGGSSGLRGIFVTDLEGQIANVCSIIRPTVGRMIVGGAMPPEGLKVAMAAAASAVHSTGAASAWTAGTPMRFTPVPVTLPLDEQIALLNRTQPDLLFGYPTTLARLATEQAAGRLSIAPGGVTTTGEALTAPHRRLIRETFGVPVINVFGTTEGLAGVTGPDSDTFVFNSDVCIVELVDDTGQPVPPGTPSAKILVTHLASHLQPLIRYEMADSLVQADDIAAHGHLRATAAGRNDDTLRFGNVELHPHVVRSVLLGVADIVDYQVRQTGAGVDVDIVLFADIDLDALSGRLTDALAAAGLPGAAVAVRRVPALAGDARTGKVRRFVRSCQAA